ncbi:superoxide dismutase [Candidatus Parvarchaeota archaeon]|uniref:Superoxide dismutase n=1 Tax=Candidatus Acidifodinimicrobium mancum TaxID=2898728 RepID=A0A8T3UPV4_9ARCH|nr:superoxide dismutase [Candidatus Acidifodinimicrobium mancum]
MNYDAQYEVKGLKYKELKGLSAKQISFHHDVHYAGYVKKRNEIHTKLKTVDKTQANANFSDFRSLKKEETFNASGQILHELYFDMLGGDGSFSNDMNVIKKINEDFGSFDNFKQELFAVAKAARGWAVLCIDPTDNKLRVFLADLHNDGAVWGAMPIIALDVYEHAFYVDYGPDKAKYLEPFFSNLDWKAIEARYNKFKSVYA